MHARGVAHRDVKPHNVLLQSTAELSGYLAHVRNNMEHLVADAADAFDDGEWGRECAGERIFAGDEKVAQLRCEWHAVLMDFGSA